MEDFFARLFHHFGLPVATARESLATGDWSPRVDISETDKEYLEKAELPDVAKDDMHVSIDNGVLTIRGEKKREKDIAIGDGANDLRMLRKACLDVACRAQPTLRG